MTAHLSARGYRGMTIAPDYAPRLGAMKRGGQVGHPPFLKSALEARRRGPRVTAAAAFEGRKGYEEDFLGDFQIAWPSPVSGRAQDLLALPGNPQSPPHHI